MSENQPAPVVGDINQIAISCHDVPRAVAFYRDTLGLPFLFDVPGMPMAFLQCGPVRLYLDGSDGEVRSTPVLYFTVPSVPDAYDELVRRGVTFKEDPHVVHRTDTSELWMAGFEDTEGTTLVVMADVPIS